MSLFLGTYTFQFEETDVAAADIVVPQYQQGVGVRTPTILKFGNVRVPYIERYTICI